MGLGGEKSASNRLIHSKFKD